VSWFRKKAKPPAIPPYQPPIQREHAQPPEAGITVEEVDMSATGIFRIFGRRPKGE
jgi:hypothetical protein